LIFSLKRLASLPLIRAELQRRKPPLYGPLIHDLSQVLYLPFDHDDGSYARDRSGYNNHGTIYGATLVAGKIGMARSFDGVDDSIEISHSDSLWFMDKDYGISFWIKTTQSPSVNVGIIWKSGDEAKSEVVLTTEGKIQYAVFKTVWSYAPTDKAINDGKWHDIAVIRRTDLAKFQFLIDGEFDSDFTDKEPKASYSNSGDVIIGRVLLRYLQASLDEMRFYNRLLSEAENARLMYLRGV